METQDDMKVREVIKIIQADGWHLVNTVGDHRQFKHGKKKGRVTVAGKMSTDIPVKTLASIFRQAQLPIPKRK
jgi:predicted RNA binding protein YcfA (HicA-like mRNA interferase family)